MSSSSWW